MTEYVLCYVRDLCGDILAIERRKQDWQQGKLNLPGGRIEVGETAEQAAIREIKEEANIDATDTTFIGSIHYAESTIYVLDCGFNPDDNEVKSSAEGEVIWFGCPELLRDPRLIPNLRVIIPLAVAGVHGWRLSPGIGASDDYCVSLDLKGCLDV